MIMVAVFLVVVLGIVLVMISTSSTHCKGSGGGVLFSYDSYVGTVDIGAEPTHHSGEPWVDFMDVEDDGFIIVYSQKGYDSKIKGIRARKNIYRYREGEGFASWYDVSSDDVDRIQSLDDLPSQKPTSTFKDCGIQIGGWFIQLLGIVMSV